MIYIVTTLLLLGLSCDLLIRYKSSSNIIQKYELLLNRCFTTSSNITYHLNIYGYEICFKSDEFGYLFNVSCFN